MSPLNFFVYQSQKVVKSETVYISSAVFIVSILYLLLFFVSFFTIYWCALSIARLFFSFYNKRDFSLSIYNVTNNYSL